MRITVIAKWFDFWIGAFYDTKNKFLYIFPVPCLGIKIEYLKKKTRAVYGNLNGHRVYLGNACDRHLYPDQNCPNCDWNKYAH
jgi:hypothetical protein